MFYLSSLAPHLLQSSGAGLTPSLYIPVMNKAVSRRSFLGYVAASASPLLFDDDAGRIRRWLEGIYNQDEPAPPPLIPQPGQWNNREISACWIGHSTVLMNLFGTTVLTDPVFRDRVGLDLGGLFTLGPKRLVAPALSVNDLPPIDVVLISHAHMDHCDLPSLELLPKSSVLVAPKGLLSLFDGLGFRKVVEVGWGESMVAGAITIEGLPVRHQGTRYPWRTGVEPGTDPGASNAYLLNTQNSFVFFGGDSAYYEGYQAIRDRENPVSLAVLPIGGYIPHHDNHCTPEEALTMADAMNAQQILPIHWGTFPGEEAADEPITRLRTTLGNRTDRIAIDRIGGTWFSSR